MIISCEQCDKNFEIESNLIPDKGRLLQCSSCNHKWFYYKKILAEPKISLKTIIDESNKVEAPYEKIKTSNNVPDINVPKRKHSYSYSENKKISFLNTILIFIISIAALIILLDTFKNPIEQVIPNIEFLLDSLYETFKDILLFIQDFFN